MSVIEIRNGSTLKFDSEKEADIIEFIQGLTEHNNFGHFQEALIRMACETPESLNKREAIKSMAEVCMQYGCTPARYRFFDDIKGDIRQLRERIDAIYDMCQKLYGLAMFQKAFNLEAQTDNLMISQFVLQQQVAQLTAKLAIDNVTYTYHSNRLTKPKEDAGETLKYIIDTYGDVVNELQALGNLTVNVKGATLENLQVNNMQGVTIAEPAKPAMATVSAPKAVDEHKQSESKASEPKNAEPKDNEEVIDFGGADLVDLNNFIGET